MDNLFLDWLDGAMFLCCAIIIAGMILLPLSKFADWLQAKLDEWNECNDKQQLNNAEQ